MLVVFTKRLSKILVNKMMHKIGLHEQNFLRGIHGTLRMVTECG